MHITPSQTDVKPGASHNHPGNKFYSKIVSDKKKGFILAFKNTQTKNSIALSIYDAIRKQNPPGRFLAKKDGSYIVRSKEDSLKKIKKALNENKAQIEQYFQLRGQLPSVNERRESLSVINSDRSLNKQSPITASDWTKLSSALTKVNSKEFGLAMGHDNTRQTKKQRRPLGQEGEEKGRKEGVTRQSPQDR